jgi:hypothetical protein
MKTTTELLFDKDLRCKGYHEHVGLPVNENYVVKVFEFPERQGSFSPVGKTLAEIKEFACKIRVIRFCEKYAKPQPSSLDSYREFNYYECQYLR